MCAYNDILPPISLGTDVAIEMKDADDKNETGIQFEKRPVCTEYLSENSNDFSLSRLYKVITDTDLAVQV